MKFNDIHKSEWPSLQPYLDTCLLPVTGLTGEEEPWRATEALERLRDLLDAVEIPFKGRVVTYPAFHYVEEESFGTSLETICRRLKASGFSYVIVAKRGSPGGMSDHRIQECDLLLTEEEAERMPTDDWRRSVRDKITAMWSVSGATKNL